MAQVPNKITKFKSLEDDLSTTVATALWKKAADLCEYINKSRPVGMLMYFNDQQTLLPEPPDPKYWKLCDGTAVVNANSPLNGVVIPDLRYRFVKHPSDGQIIFGVDGADTVNIDHNHGGVTEYEWPGAGFDSDNDTDRAGPFTHRHNISASSKTVVSTVPDYKEFPVYIRIL
jgi:hypothetical protein